MCCDADTEAALRRAGLKLTVQRMAVACAVRHADGHVKAQEVARTVRAARLTLDVSTVYRTLALLHESGFVTQTDMGHGDLVFEWVGHGAHHHVVCSRCGDVQAVSAGLTEPLVRALRREYGFYARIEHLALSGLCAECAPQQRRHDPDRSSR